jgi:HEAT repeat protein
MKKTFKSCNFKQFFSCFIVAFLALISPGCDRSSPQPFSFVPDNTAGFVPEATRIVQQSLSDDAPQVRANAIEVIAVVGLRNMMPRVERLLNDDFVPVRFTAALAVGDLKYAPAKNLLIRMLRDSDENSRIAAAYALYKLGVTEHFGLLGRALASEDQTVRANAAFLLGKSGDKNAVKLLYWTMRAEDSDDKVIYTAAEARARLGDEQILPKLWAMLISAYADVRVTGVRAMGALGTADAHNALVTMLDDDVLEVRLAAAEQLGMLGDTVGEPKVLEVFTKNLTAGLDENDLERVNVLTAMAIGRIGTRGLTKFLPPLLKSPSKSVRLAAARAVLQCTTGY